jgi:alkylhydroperoxidase family enzyme
MPSTLPYPNPQDLSPDAKLLLASRPSRNVFRMLAHSSSTLPGVLELTRAILYDGKLAPTLRELAILRVGHLCGSAYEVHQHRKIAAAVGLDAARIDGTAVDAEAASTAGFSAEEVFVLAFVEQVVRQTRADVALRDRMVATLGMEQTMELLVLIGTYVMLAQVLENTGVDLEGDDGPPASEVEQIFGRQALG